jgi:hypothetical protein
MGALEDYYNYIESQAQAAKAKMWSGLESGYAGLNDYLTNAKADAYRGGPSDEELLRLKRQQIKDQYIQDTQEMRDRANPQTYQPPQVMSEPQPEVQPAAQPGPIQEPPAPQIPAGWSPSQAPQEQLPPETLAALTPEERFAVAQGYAPAQAQAVSAAPVQQPALPQETASPLIPPQQAQRPAPRRLETTPAVNTAFEEMLKQAPKELQPMFRSMKAANDQRSIAKREAASQAMQQVDQYRQAEHQAIDAGEQEAAKNGHLAYGAVQYAVSRDRATADKNAEMAKAELSAQGMEPTAASEFLKDARSRINDKYKDATKPFEETDQYKRAMNSLDSMGKEIRDQNNLQEQIGQLKSYLNAGKVDSATRYAKATVAQTVNSLRNQNAIQTTEMLIRYADLLDPQTRASLTGKWLGADFVGKLAQGLFSPKDSDKLKENTEGVKEFLAEVYRAAPEKFLQTTIDTSNANAAALNQALIDFVIRPTSQKLSKVELFKMEPAYVLSLIHI